MEQIVKYSNCSIFHCTSFFFPDLNTLLKTKYYFTQKGVKVINISWQYPHIVETVGSFIQKKKKTWRIMDKQRESANACKSKTELIWRPTIPKIGWWAYS